MINPTLNSRSEFSKDMISDAEDDANQKLSLTEIRKKEIYLRLRMNLGITLATILMGMLQLIIAIMMGASVISLGVHDYYLMILFCAFAVLLTLKYRQLVLAGWITTAIYAYSNLMEVTIRNSLLQSILYNGGNYIYIYIYNA